MGQQKQTILVLGRTHNQIPLIQAAKKMGFRTIILGAGASNVIVSALADASLPVDTSDKNAVLHIAEKENAIGLVTCGTGPAMCTIAYINEKLKLSDKIISLTVAENAVLKNRYRDYVTEYLPRGFSSGDVNEAFIKSKGCTYPVIIKPGDGGGGKGIVIVTQVNKKEFVSAFNYACEFSRTKKIIVEEYIEGSVLGVESFILDGNLHQLAIADKTMSPPPWSITLGVVFPSRLPKQVQERIERVNSEIIERLGIKWGATHIDMVVDGQGEPKVIDIGPRLAGGALMSRLVPEAYGYDFYSATIKLAIGKMPEPPGPCNCMYYASRFLLSPRTGTLKSVIISSNAAAQNDIENFQQIIEDGGELHEAQNDRARVISFTSKAQTYENVLRNLDEFSKSVTITVE